MTTEKRYKTVLGKGFGGAIDKLKRKGVGIFVDGSRMVCVSDVSSRGVRRSALKEDIKIRFSKSGSHHFDLGALEMFAGEIGLEVV